MSAFKSQTPEYKSWEAMIRRCTDPRHEKFKHYGVRGITVCQRWLESFDDFLECMGNRPNGFSINRKDNQGNYCPENCIWSSKLTQENNKSNNTKLTFNGKTLSLADWAREIGIKKNTLIARIVTYKIPPAIALVATKLKTGPK